MANKNPVVAYVRVSTEEQGIKGASLAAQKTLIRAACRHHGLSLLRIDEDILSGSTMKRPGLQRALADCRDGTASGIVVAKLDRLSRSLVDFATLLEEARARPFNVIALDLGLDLDTPHGEFVASVLAAAAQWERRVNGARTRAGMAERRAQGVHIGRPPSIPDDVRTWIRDAYGAGANLAQITDSLNIYNVPTARGGALWRSSTVKKVVADVKRDKRRRVRGLSIPPGRTYRGALKAATPGGRPASGVLHADVQEADSERQ